MGEGPGLDPEVVRGPWEVSSSQAVPVPVEERAAVVHISEQEEVLGRVLLVFVLPESLQVGERPQARESHFEISEGCSSYLHS